MEENLFEKDQALAEILEKDPTLSNVSKQYPSLKKVFEKYPINGELFEKYPNLMGVVKGLTLFDVPLGELGKAQKNIRRYAEDNGVVSDIQETILYIRIINYKVL